MVLNEGSQATKGASHWTCDNSVRLRSYSFGVNHVITPRLSSSQTEKAWQVQVDG